MFLKITIVLLVTTFVNTSKITFNGHRVYKVIPNNENEREIVKSIQTQGIGEFWLDQFDVSDGVRITVAPEKYQQFEDTMNRNDIKYKEIIADLQQ